MRKPFRLIAVAAMLALAACGPAGSTIDPTGSGVAEPPPKPSTPIVLHVNSSSWVEGSTFPQAEFDELCEDAGISFAGEGALEATITYEETQGGGYSASGMGAPTSWGTVIRYSITLDFPDGRLPRVRREVQTATPGYVSEDELHEAARRKLIEHKMFQNSCTLIAAVLGSREDQAKFLEGAVILPEHRDLLDMLHFTAQTPEEKAYLLAARREFDEMEALGDAARIPLKTALRILYADDGWWRSMNPLDRPIESGAAFARALELHLPFKDAETSALIAGILFPCCYDWPDRKSLFRAALIAARDVGDQSTLPALHAFISSAAVWDDEELKQLVEDAKNGVNARP